MSTVDESVILVMPNNNKKLLWTIKENIYRSMLCKIFFIILSRY